MRSDFSSHLIELDIIFVYSVAPKALTAGYGYGVIYGNEVLVIQMSVFIACKTHVMVAGCAGLCGADLCQGAP